MNTVLMQYYTVKDVAKHTSRPSCWITRHGKVFDVSGFLTDHPGGDDLILKYAGKDVEDIMSDNAEHEHSEYAYGLLDDFITGKLYEGEADDNVEISHNYNTDKPADFEERQFLDLRKPLMRQVWESNFSKSYYLSQVHQPRHLPEPVRLFSSSYLEVFTRTKWYVVPIVWLPVAFNLFLRSAVGFSCPLPSFFAAPLFPFSASIAASVTHAALASSLVCFFAGSIIWTILEYSLHRFLFHLDNYLPDHPKAIFLHFMLHGIHHYVPMDRLRLVMPPVLSSVLAFPFTRLVYIIFPTAVANGIISGTVLFYVYYDCMHYALHHKTLPAYMHEMKRYHLAHHYKNFDLGFGVTSKLWDYVFNTILPL